MTLHTRLTSLVRPLVTLAVVASFFIPFAQQTAFAGLALPSTADYGDAPDSSNPTTTSMPAYPGVQANFPTVFTPGAASAAGQGPKHNNSTVHYALGRKVSAEWLAESGLDHDDVTNLDLATPAWDQDGSDDGVRLPDQLAHCQPQQIQVAVTAFDTGQSFPARVRLNLWMDFDRSGNWGGALDCGGGVMAQEWTVQNYLTSLPAAGTHIITLPATVMWNAGGNATMWMRVTLSEAPAPGEDGGGPASGYLYGETEDYLLEASASPPASVALPPLQIDELKAEAPVPPIILPLVTVPPRPWSPDDFVIPEGELTEVDMAHIGGYYGGTPPFAVTIAGTGSAARPASWDLGNPLGAPNLMQLGPVRLGHDHQIHTLTPDNGPSANYEIFVMGLLRDDTLWLSTWRLLPTGHFQHLDSRGYGPNAGVAPQHYTMAHRILPPEGDTRRAQLITPLIHNNGILRIVTWEVNSATGAISGRSDSGDVDATLAADSALSATWVAGEGLVAQHYVVSAISDAGNLLNSYWEVDNAGEPRLRSLRTSGRNLRNTGNITQLAQTVSIAPINDTGFLSAIDVGGGTPQLRMHSWEALVDNCNADEGCDLVPSNISDNSQDLNQAGLGVQIPLPTLTTDRVYLLDPRYDLTLFTRNPNVIQAIASVRKVMVALVTLDQIAAGNVSFDDEVEVSEEAAGVNNTSASSVGLQEGEVLTLRELLYAMMMNSGGDATWAISEHVGGNLDGMVGLMNAKADDLDLDQTNYCRNPASEGFSSVGYSTAEDQARLWASAWDDPLFLDIVGRPEADVCGTLPGGEELCHPAIPPMTHNMSGYPNLDGHKTGGGGGLCTGFGVQDNLPTCVSGGCLSIQASRIQRPLVISELQPSTMVGDRWNDAWALFDYGYRVLFTPDFVVNSGAQGGPVTDFGMTVVDDGAAATATINGGTLMFVCNWTMQVFAGDLTKHGCATQSLTGMAPGIDAPPPTRLDLERFFTVESDGDYLLGRLEGGVLMLRLWRVGEKDF